MLHAEPGTRSPDPEARRTTPVDDGPTDGSGGSDDLGVFDRFAGKASHVASRAPFFAFCVALVVVWAPSILILKDIDTWQLIINTLTTIVTFLMVALLQNSQYRTDEATQDKLNAIAASLADLMEHVATPDRSLDRDIDELQQSVGLEQRERS
jgi:low affinity Fe/Cu permease